MAAIKKAIKMKNGVTLEHWELLTVFYEAGVRSVHTWRGWVSKAEKEAGSDPVDTFVFSVPVGAAPELAAGVDALSTAQLKLQSEFEGAEDA